MVYKRGSRGEMVKKIQQLLHQYPDGIFGPQTEEAVKEFQRDNGLKPDGIVGTATLTKLRLIEVGQKVGVLKKSKRRIDLIIVHCTDTPPYRDVTVSDIRTWHKKNGWSDIGYHYVVYLDGSVHVGRDVDVVGAHCEGRNQHSIGVVYVGGRADDNKTYADTRNAAQKASLRSLLKELKGMYPEARICGHRDFANRACPCFDARKEYQNI